MTERQTSSASEQSPRQSRDRYLTALDRVSDVVARAARTDRWNLRSPCPGWSARHVLGHLVDGQRQVRAMLSGAPLRTPTADPSVLAGTDPRAAWEHARDGILATLSELSDEPRSALRFPTPLGERDLSEVLDTAIIEPQVHAWDLAAAAGVEVDLDADDVRHTLGLLEGMGEALHGSGMYGAALPTATGMPPGRRLLALTGRDPDWGGEA